MKFKLATVEDPALNAPVRLREVPVAPVNVNQLERASAAPVALLKFNVVSVVDAADNVPVMERPEPVAPENPRFVAKRFVEVELSVVR